jgi:poly-gamma-glutamate synthesis protein (capsule biosynthesis protein)
MNGDLLWHNTLWFGAKEDAQRRRKGGYDFGPLARGNEAGDRIRRPRDLSRGGAASLGRAGRTGTYPIFAAPPQVVT